MTRLRVTLLVFFVAAVGATNALACSCVMFANPQDHIDSTDLIFEGRALSTMTTRDDDTFRRQQTVFAVVRVWKGDATGRVVVSHPENVCCNCGVTFDAGQTYKVFVFAYADGADRFTTTLCSLIPLEVFDWEKYEAVLEGNSHEVSE